MFCSNCGMQNNDGAKFCRGCGQPLTAAENAAFGGTGAGQAGAATDPYGSWSQNQGAAQAGAATDPYGSWNQSQGAQAGAATDPYGSRNQNQGAQAGAATDPYGSWNQNQGAQPGAGTDPYGSWNQNQGAQAGAATDPYGSWNQSQGAQAGAATDPYGSWNQNQGAQAGAGTDPYGSWNQGAAQPGGSPYGGYQQNPYGANPYAQQAQQPRKTKKKKGIVAVVIVVLLAALIGGGVFLYIKGSDPMTPVDQFFDAMMDGDWDKVYDTIYWGEAGDEGYMSKAEFTDGIESSGGSMIGLAGGYIDLDISLVSEGETYVGDDGLTRKNITVEMTAEVMGIEQSQEMEMAVVKSAKKFFFIPAWQIDNEVMGQMF